jgi:hypothetical protein
MNPRGSKSFQRYQGLSHQTPVLVAPHKEEPLLLYIVATTQVVNMAIVVERKEEGHIQTIQ